MIGKSVRIVLKINSRNESHLCLAPDSVKVASPVAYMRSFWASPPRVKSFTGEVTEAQETSHLCRVTQLVRLELAFELTPGRLRSPRFCAVACCPWKVNPVSGEGAGGSGSQEFTAHVCTF